ncbi:Asp23/Gls24 family envelope stress response protein [Enterococcus sp. BWM-S5]|uniref:Stress response regulator gls24 homolog n=1 Tax=Enterococcus larvae TaxID=2794352 RepID=A0ABS4CG13_9ENTE|nr:Asp23/Gls24 family envelope stress response protein [Enterococcus larvae]MBP1045570.1 Asp23/Gls24 family envelope stress response protein [Enterococcus larvae]
MSIEQADSSTLAFEEKVLEVIVQSALTNVDGVLSLEGKLFAADQTEPLAAQTDFDKGVTLEREKNQVTVDLAIVVEFGKDFTGIFSEIKRIVSEEIQRMTNLEVVEVNVHIADITTKDEYKKISSESNNEAAEVEK